MDNLKMISIIVPIYNVEKYLDKCLESIVNQTYKNMEIILVNNGSTDNSLTIAKSWQYQDNRIKVFSIDNKGVSYARNYGIKVSNGNYIAFVDSDDWIDRDMYETLMNGIIRYSADIAQCSYYVNSKDKQVLIKKGKENLLLNNAEGVKNVLTADIFFPAIWNKLYKKKIITEYFKKLNIAEDRLFNIEVFRNAKSSIYIDECKYHYYQRNDSVIHQKFSEKNLDVLKSYQIISSIIKKEYPLFLDLALKNEIIECFVQLGSICLEKKVNNFM
ncbi:glycosyltransferase, partial [Thomasclavelia cocleata]